MTAPIDIVSVTDQVHAILRERILAGSLPHHIRLRQEAISAELGVSRTPVREALGRLAADGLVELEPNKGFRVADVRPEDMLAAYEARLVIEPAAARAAAACGADVAPMRAAIAAQRSADGDVAAAFQANRDFHLQMVRASGNPFLVRFAEHLWAGRLGARVYETQLDSSAALAADAHEHEAIAAAIAAADEPGAERATRQHIANAMTLLPRR
jgi:DNA-binding GntR family transcriptional regulator